METSDKKPGQLRAINVTGGVCFHMGFLGLATDRIVFLAQNSRKGDQEGRLS